MEEREIERECVIKRVKERRRRREKESKRERVLSNVWHESHKNPFKEKY